MQYTMRNFLFGFFLLMTTSAFSQGVQVPMAKVKDAMYIIANAYVDSVNLEKLQEDAIVGMLKELDPHSSYISSEDLKSSREVLEGAFEGIGIQFQLLRDTIVVISPISGGPSEKLGIKAGDRIVSIEGKPAAGVKLKNEDVIKKLRGPKGSKVNVSVQKVGTNNLIDYTITRDKIPIFSVLASYMVEPGTGYIKVSNFSQTTADEFRAALSKLNEKGMKNLILDLTDNPGGVMQASIEMADEFLTDRKLIVYQEGLNSPRIPNYATAKGAFENGKLVVMVDEGSASASEIVAGAVQDWDRGLIIGRRTFGKGLVQRPYMLADGSQIRLTIARYYTPVGRNIQKAYDQGTDAYYKDLSSRYLRGEFYQADSIHLPDSLKFYTPNQRLVFGGGGIMPDLFVPMDTSHKSDFLESLLKRGIPNQFSLNYVDENRKMLSVAFPSAAQFVESFSPDQSFMKSFFDFAAKDSVPYDDAGYKTSGDFIRNLLKGRIAQDLYGNDAMFEVFNKTNPMMKKALAVLRDDTFSKMKIAGK